MAILSALSNKINNTINCISQRIWTVGFWRHIEKLNDINSSVFYNFLEQVLYYSSDITPMAKINWSNQYILIKIATIATAKTHIQHLQVLFLTNSDNLCSSLFKFSKLASIPFDDFSKI
ncbi:Uncharacterized protein FWK35_00008690, partial [Aphis craccivora]